MICKDENPNPHAHSSEWAAGILLHKSTLTCSVSDRSENPTHQPRNVCLLSGSQFHDVITYIMELYTHVLQPYVYRDIAHRAAETCKYVLLFKCIVSHRWSRTVRSYAQARAYSFRMQRWFTMPRLKWSSQMKFSWLVLDIERRRHESMTNRITLKDAGLFQSSIDQMHEFERKWRGSS